MNSRIDQVRGSLESTLETIFLAASNVYKHEHIPQHLVQMLRLHGLAESPIINAPPGSGKTHIATELVNRIYDEHGLTTLYLVPNHEAEKNVPGREGWNHWEGHSRLCGQNGSESDLLITKGYAADNRHEGECEWAEQFTSGAPTLAPIQYLFGQDHVALARGYQGASVAPIRPEVSEFHIRIIDEFTFEQFVKGMSVSEVDFNRVASWHPEGIVKKMCRALIEGLMTMQERDSSLLGVELISQLLIGISQIGEEQDAFFAELQEFAMNPTLDPWESVEAVDQPMNFAPYLSSLLIDEYHKVQSGTLFNPRVELNAPKSAFTEIRWRRPVEDIRPTLVLDATSNPELAERALFGHNFAKPRNLVMPIPAGVEIYQYVDKRVTRGAMGLWGNKESALKPKLFDLIVRDLQRLHPGAEEVGIVTFKKLQDELREHLERAGIKVAEASAYYGASRGLNRLSHVSTLLMVGTHIPRRIEFEREARAFFDTEEPLLFNWGSMPASIDALDGRQVLVRFNGYRTDTRVENFYSQKTTAEMVQALHRARPNLVQAGDKKRILVYTSDPIPGVQVTDYLGRSADYARTLNDLLKQEDRVSIPELARSGVEPEVLTTTADRYIRRNRESIEVMAGANWNGKRFSTNAN